MTLVGQTIHGYKFLEGIAVGGFSEVYKAHHLETGQNVAIKRINSDKVIDGKATERFEIEAGVITQLNDSHIPPVYDNWHYDNWHDESGHFMVMKWMANGSLRRHIDAGGMRDLPTIIKWIVQIGSALQTTHDAGLIHRDVKPDNIMFDEAYNAYLADFGLAKDTTRDQPLTQIGWKLGSQAYSSPEQISNEGEATPQSDIFAFGVTIFETLTATHPFIDDSADNIRWMIKALRDPMPLVHFMYPEIPAEIDDVLQKATQKDPADRYQSVKEMVTAFQQFDKPVELSATSDEPLPPSIPVEIPDALPAKKGIFGRLFGRS